MAEASKSDIISSGTSLASGISSGISSSINSNSGGPSTWVTGVVCLEVLGQAVGLLVLAMGVGLLVWGWGGWPRNLIDAEIFPAVQFQFLIPHGVIQFGHWEVFFVLGFCCQCWWGGFIKG